MSAWDCFVVPNKRAAAMCFKRNFQLRSGKQILRKLLAPVGGLRGETYEKLLNRLALFNARKEIWETWEKFKATGNIFAFVRNMLPPLTEVSAQTSLIDWFLKFGSLSNDSEATDLANVLKKVPILEEKSWDWKSLLEPFKELVPAKFVLGLFDKLGFGRMRGVSSGVLVRPCRKYRVGRISSNSSMLL